MTCESFLLIYDCHDNRLCKCHSVSHFFALKPSEKRMIWTFLASLVSAYYVPILTTQIADYHHSVLNIDKAVKTAVQHVDSERGSNKLQLKKNPQQQHV